MEPCYYCKSERAIGIFPHPRFRQQSMPTCEKCYHRLNLYYTQFRLLGWFVLIFGPGALLAALVLATESRWTDAGCAVLVAMVAIVLWNAAVRHYSKKRDRMTGDYVDTKAIRWCRTCRFHRKVRSYEDSFKGAWTLPVMPDVSTLPCSNVAQTHAVWVEYYARPPRERALFPKNCPVWAGK